MTRDRPVSTGGTDSREARPTAPRAPAGTSQDAGTRTDRPTSLLALQRAAGNRAVSGMLECPGAGAPGPALQRQFGMGARFRRSMREDEERNRAIRAGKRPAGAEIVRLPDWNLITPRSAPTRTLGHRLAEMTLLTIPIPKLGVRVDLRASAGASLNLEAFYAGWLRNIQIGVEPWQDCVSAGGSGSSSTAETSVSVSTRPRPPISRSSSD